MVKKAGKISFSESHYIASDISSNPIPEPPLYVLPTKSRWFGFLHRKKPESTERNPPMVVKKEGSKTVPASDLEGEDNTIPPRRAWYLFYKKTARPYLYAKLILPNDRIITRPVWITGKSVFNFGKCSYAVNREAIKNERIDGKLRPVSYYFYEYPDPINFIYQETYMQKTAPTFQKILNAKVIEDAVSRAESWLIYVVLIASCVSAIGVIYVIFRMGKGG